MDGIFDYLRGREGTRSRLKKREDDWPYWENERLREDLEYSRQRGIDEHENYDEHDARPHHRSHHQNLSDLAPNARLQPTGAHIQHARPAPSDACPTRGIEPTYTNSGPRVGRATRTIPSPGIGRANPTINHSFRERGPTGTVRNRFLDESRPTASLRDIADVTFAHPTTSLTLFKAIQPTTSWTGPEQRQRASGAHHASPRRDERPDEPAFVTTVTTTTTVVTMEDDGYDNRFYGQHWDP